MNYKKQVQMFYEKKIKRNLNSKTGMMNSFNLAIDHSAESISREIPKFQFKECFYHSKPIKYLCISENCLSKYFLLCDHPECKTMHSHPSVNFIETSKFEQFTFDHLKSINIFKARISKYQKEVIEQMVHKIIASFEIVQNSIERFYVHKAAKKLSQGKLDELNAKQINQFIEKATLARKKSLQTQPVSSELIFEPFMDDYFIQQRNQISSTIQKLLDSITKLTQTEQFKVLTLQKCVFGQSCLGFSAQKNLIKKETFTSKIIQLQEEYFSLLKMWKENRFTAFKEFRLVYRASESNFSSEKYHQAVDNKSPLLLIILAETGHKFGAFLNCKTTQCLDWISDPTGLSFIFSLDHNQAYQLKSAAYYRTKAVFGGNKGPQIGVGCDIYISDKCNLNAESGANFGGSYELPFGIDFGSKKAKAYLAGKENFVITEYEAFELI